MKIRLVNDRKHLNGTWQVLLKYSCYQNLLVPLALPNTTLTTYGVHSDSSKIMHKIVSCLYRLLVKMRYHLLLRFIRHRFIPEILVCLSFCLECFHRYHGPGFFSSFQPHLKCLLPREVFSDHPLSTDLL